MVVPVKEAPSAESPLMIGLLSRRLFATPLLIVEASIVDPFKYPTVETAMAGEGTYACGLVTTTGEYPP